MCYLGKAEARAAKFEGGVEKGLHEVYEEVMHGMLLSADHKKDCLAHYASLHPISAKKKLLEALNRVCHQLNVATDKLVYYASRYEGYLREGLDDISAKTQLEADLEGDEPDKAEDIHKKVMEMVAGVQIEVGDTEKWLQALVEILNKAEGIMDELQSDERGKALALLREGSLSSIFQRESNEESMQFLVEHYDDLVKVKSKLKDRFSNIFWYVIGKPNPGFFNAGTWPVIMELIQARSKDDFCNALNSAFNGGENFVRLTSCFERTEERDAQVVRDLFALSDWFGREYSTLLGFDIVESFDETNWDTYQAYMKFAFAFGDSDKKMSDYISVKKMEGLSNNVYVKMAEVLDLIGKDQFVDLIDSLSRTDEGYVFFRDSRIDGLVSIANKYKSDTKKLVVNFSDRIFSFFSRDQTMWEAGFQVLLEARSYDLGSTHTTGRRHRRTYKDLFLRTKEHPEGMDFESLIHERSRQLKK